MKSLQYYFLSIKLAFNKAKKQIGFKGMLIWFFAWLPVFLIYKITGLFIYLHDYSAEKANQLDDYIYNIKNKGDDKVVTIS